MDDDIEIDEVNAMLPLFAKAEKMEKSTAFGSLRPQYGRQMQCPHTSYSIKDVLTGEIRI